MNILQDFQLNFQMFLTPAFSFSPKVVFVFCNVILNIKQLTKIILILPYIFKHSASEMLILLFMYLRRVQDRLTVIQKIFTHTLEHLNQKQISDGQIKIFLLGNLDDAFLLAIQKAHTYLSYIIYPLFLAAADLH